MVLRAKVVRLGQLVVSKRWQRIDKFPARHRVLLYAFERGQAAGSL
jgi:hypothetical protein